MTGLAELAGGKATWAFEQQHGMAAVRNIEYCYPVTEPLLRLTEWCFCDSGNICVLLMAQSFNNGKGLCQPLPEVLMLGGAYLELGEFCVMQVGNYPR